MAGNIIPSITWKDVEFRFKPNTWKPERLKITPSIDSILGGLPNSLTVFYGESGTGKSTFAKYITKVLGYTGTHVVYLLCESYGDMPVHNSYIHVGDYTRYLPQHVKAVEELFVAAHHFGAKLVVIDSATRFFSGTRKAVEEADIRSALWDVAKRAEKEGLSIIAISEIRGTGNYLYPAGGRAVDHAASLLVKFDRIEVDKWIARDYDFNIGNKLYTVEVMKDKYGIADAANKYVILYEDGKLVSVKLSEYMKMHRKMEAKHEIQRQEY